MDAVSTARQIAAADAAKRLARVRADIRRLSEPTCPHPDQRTRDTTAAMLDSLLTAERRLQAQVECWAARFSGPTTEDTA